MGGGGTLLATTSYNTTERFPRWMTCGAPPGTQEPSIARTMLKTSMEHNGALASLVRSERKIRPVEISVKQPWKALLPKPLIPAGTET